MINGSNFAGYSKCWGENSRLEVFIHLKYAIGKVVTLFSDLIKIETESVYSDELPNPLMPQKPRGIPLNRSKILIPLFKTESNFKPAPVSNLFSYIFY